MYIFFDTETTGLEDDAEIAQFAALLVDQEKKVVGEFKAMVKPDGWVMPEATAKFHGITQERLEKYGVDIRGVFTLFNRWCAMAEVLVAHNIEYDIGRLRHVAQRKGIAIEMPHKSFCTQTAACPIIRMPPTERMVAAGRGDQFKNPKLIEAYEHFFGTKFNGAHDAMADVKACARIYFHIQGLTAPKPVAA